MKPFNICRDLGKGSGWGGCSSPLGRLCAHRREACGFMWLKASCGSGLGLSSTQTRSQADLPGPARQGQEHREDVGVTEATLGHGGPQRPGAVPATPQVTWCPTCRPSCWGTSSRWASRPGCPRPSCCCCWTDAGPRAAPAAWGAGAAGRRPGGRTGLA